MVIIITGDSGSGKTSFLRSLVLKFKEYDIPVGGILAPSSHLDMQRDSYILNDLSTNESLPFISTSMVIGWEKFKRFWFNPEGFVFGSHAISTALSLHTPAVVVDELGPLELEGKGWATEFEEVLRQEPPILLVSVRRSLLPDIKKRFNIIDPVIWYAGAANADAAGSYLQEHLRSDFNQNPDS